MSIKALAVDLYKAKQRMESLEKQLETVAQSAKVDLDQELKYARQEFETLRRMLDGEKESGSFRKKFTGFGTSN